MIPPAISPFHPFQRQALASARWAGLASVLIGGVVLLGWIFDLEILKTVLPGLPTMKANTAIGFLLGGSALRWLAGQPEDRLGGKWNSGVVLAGLITLLGAVTLLEYALGWNLGLDELLFRDAKSPAVLFPGRMAPTTAFCFVLLGTGLLALGRRRARTIHPLVPGLLATLLACVAGLALFGYSADISAAHTWGPFTGMAVPAAACFLILSTGLVALAQAVRPEFPLGRWLSLSAALLIVTLLGLLTRETRRGTVEATELVTRTLVVQQLLGNLRAELADVQIGSRGFLITGNEQWLQPHLQGAEAARRHLRELRQLTLAPATPPPPLDALETAAVQLTEWYHDLAETRRREGFSAAQRLVLAGTGEKLLAHAQQLVADLQGAENLRLQEQEARLDQRQRETSRLLVAGSVSAFLFIGFAGWVAQRELGRREQIEKNLHQAKELLEQRVQSRTAELSRTVDSLHQEITQRTAAEASLRESEERFRTVTETLPQLVWSCRSDGFCDYLGPQWVAYTGIPEAEQLGYGWGEQLHPDDRDRTLATWAQAVTMGGLFDIEFRIRRHDGVYRRFQTRAVPLRDQAGGILKWFGTNTDIEDLRLAEDALRESEYLSQLATEVTEVGIWRWHLPTNRVFWDQQMFRLYGQTPTPDGAVDYALWSQAVLPADLPRQETLLQDTILRRGRSSREFGIRRHHDGATRFIQAVETTRLNPRNEVEWVVGTNLDITDRKQAEEALRLSLKETLDLRAALDEHAIVAITDAQGRITYVNDKFCAISQYARTELMGQDHRLINSSHHPKEFIRDLWATISSGHVWSGEIKNCAKDGSTYWVATTIVPFLDELGRPRQYIAIRADITARKQAEGDVLALNAQLAQRVSQLEAANQELEAFSYSVSHDLRAPLRGIDGFARLLEDDQGARLDGEGRRRLGIIRGESQRMGQLIDALLAFSRLGRQLLAPGPVDPQALAQDAWTTLVRPHPERAAQLACPTLPPAHGDRVLLQQVFSNLLGNALKFTRHQPAPLIEVGGTAGPAEHTYFVRDNGAGFDPRHANKLFGVFQRLHRESEFEGTGIGLALVQRILHRHGGRIWAEGAPGRGATFFFTLPAQSRTPTS